eukprot:5073642-Pleurochrysis_carterae.AAC.3
MKIWDRRLAEETRESDVEEEVCQRASARARMRARLLHGLLALSSTLRKWVGSTAAALFLHRTMRRRTLSVPMRASNPSRSISSNLIITSARGQTARARMRSSTHASGTTTDASSKSSKSSR